VICNGDIMLRKCVATRIDENVVYDRARVCPPGTWQARVDDTAFGCALTASAVSAIEFQGVAKHYDSVRAVDDLSLAKQGNWSPF
jgi:hypothetical protein